MTGRHRYRLERDAPMQSTEQTRKEKRAGRQGHLPKRGLGPPFTLSPCVAAAITTAAFFCLALFVLRPGYWINDDLKIIWNIAGYPGARDPQPFIIFSNVLLGLMLAPLYGLRTPVNWYVLFLTIVNVSSIWALVHLAFTPRRQPASRLLGGTVVLAGVATLTLNITYTVSAFLATLAGMCLVYASAQREAGRWQGPAFCGVMLVFVGSLIRQQMCALALVVALPGMLIAAGSTRCRRLLLVVAASSMMVFLGYLVDRLYVRAAPDWNAFYAYTRVAQSLHDSHRLNNVHAQIRRIGWTPNDQELFARWFYPDQSLYSVERLRYLVDKVAPTTQDAWGSVLGFLITVASVQFVSYSLWMIAMVLHMFAEGTSRRLFAAVTSAWMMALAENLGLSLLYKDPSYVLASTLAGSLALGPVFLALSSESRGHRPEPNDGRSSWRRRVRATAWTLVLVGAGILIGRFLESSESNISRQANYGRVRSDLQELQRRGALEQDALIVSPAHGLPYEWSYPFTLDLPAPAYLDTGWITFAPSYTRVLSDHGIGSLQDALVRADNVYLMTQADFTPFLARYYEEHYDLDVQFESIYAMPNPSMLAGYDGIFVYKLESPD